MNFANLIIGLDSETDTPAPPTDTPTATNTPVPPTNTPVPANARDVSNISLSSNQAGVLAVTWNAPSETPRDYRVAWAKVGENFRTWSDTSVNAFPTSNSYTITGLEGGQRYKVLIRARYHSGGPGPWSNEHEPMWRDEADYFIRGSNRLTQVAEKVYQIWSASVDGEAQIFIAFRGVKAAPTGPADLILYISSILAGYLTVAYRRKPPQPASNRGYFICPAASQNRSTWLLERRFWRDPAKSYGKCCFPGASTKYQMLAGIWLSESMKRSATSAVVS